MDYPYFLSGFLLFIAPPLIIMLISRFRKTAPQKTPAWQYVIVFMIMSLLMLTGLHEYKLVIVVIGFFFYVYAYLRQRKTTL